MDSLKTQDILYKIGIPTDNPMQSELAWVKNGEPLNGSTSNIGSDGTLNRVPFQIQQNVEILSGNDTLIQNKVNSMSDNIDRINEALNTGHDVTLAERVTVAENSISTIQGSIDTHEKRIGDLEVSDTAIKSDIGNQTESGDTYYRTVRDDLLYIKREIGNDAGFDINGQAVDNLGSSGIKNKIESISQSSSNHENRIVILEDINKNFDLTEMKQGIDSARNELGPSSNAPQEGVYQFITNAKAKESQDTGKLDELNAAVDITNAKTIAQRTTELESEITDISNIVKTPETGISAVLSNVVQEIGNEETASSIKGNIKVLQDSNANLKTTVGVDDSSGLRSRTLYIEKQIGKTSDDGKATEGSILDVLPKHTAEISEISDNVQSIQISLSNKLDDISGQALYLRTAGKWVKAASSTMYLTYSGSVATTKDTPSVIDLSKGSVRVSNNSSNGSDGVKLVDEGIYDIDVELVISKDQSDSLYTLDLSNGETLASSTSGYMQSITGKQVIRLSTMIQTTGQAVLKLLISSDKEQTTVIDSLRFKVKPVI